jgi:hypothetical protein
MTRVVRGLFSAAELVHAYSWGKGGVMKRQGNRACTRAGPATPSLLDRFGGQPGGARQQTVPARRRTAHSGVVGR